MEQTLCIIKPDAVKNSFVNEINKIIEDNKLIVLKSKKIKISKDIAEIFYSEHKGKPFFSDLVDFMTSDYSVVQILQEKTLLQIIGN